VSRHQARVLMFAPVGDEHAQVVGRELRSLGAYVHQTSLCSVLDSSFTVRPGDGVHLAGTQVDGSWTVWWRRTGAVGPRPGMGALEQRLRAEETEALLVGGLLSVRPRWVDAPAATATAEHTLLQLTAATSAGARVPATVATNVAAEADALLAASECVTKATSSGVGIAPHADLMPPTLTCLLPNAPALLQRHVRADADVRVVVVAHDAFVWSRARREGEPVDWRACDPSGGGFAPGGAAGVAALAVEITRRLGLTFSVQDWVVSDGEPSFLEANPSGQWLFLADAARIVAPALAAHLAFGVA